jgi:hypothetical protein
MSSEDGITVRQTPQITSATKSAKNGLVQCSKVGWKKQCDQHSHPSLCLIGSRRNATALLPAYADVHNVIDNFSGPGRALPANAGHGAYAPVPSIC